MDSVPSTLHREESLKQWRNGLKDVSSPLSSPFPRPALLQCTMHERVLDALARHSERNITAIIEAHTDRKITHRELRDKSLRMAAFLDRKGCSAGEIIAIALPNSIEYVISSIGAMSAGGSINGIKIDFGDFEMRGQFTRCAPTVIITLESMLEKAYICVRDLPTTNGLPPGVFDYNDALTEEPIGRLVPVSLRDTVQVFESSGTTGECKGVLHSHFAFTNALHQWQRNWELELYPAIGVPEVDWYSECQVLTLPSCHLFGYASILLYLIAGSPIILLQQFEEEVYLRMIETYRPRVLNLIPPILNFLMKSEKAKAADLSSLELILTASSASGSSVCEQLLQREMKLKYIVQGYGMTEVCGFSHLPLVMNRKVYESIGVITPLCQQRIMNTITGEPCAIGEPGELWIKSEVRMTSYRNNPEATAEILDADGFIHSGDMAYMDENGLVYITGRIKENIKVNAVMVSPTSVENLLLSHPKIADAAIVGVPDEERGEKIVAIIVRKDDFLTEDEVRNFVKDRMSHYSHITGPIHFVESIPRSAPGKLQRRKLLENISKNA